MYHLFLLNQGNMFTATTFVYFVVLMHCLLLIRTLAMTILVIGLPTTVVPSGLRTSLMPHPPLLAILLLRLLEIFKMLSLHPFLVLVRLLLLLETGDYCNLFVYFLLNLEIGLDQP